MLIYLRNEALFAQTHHTLQQQRMLKQRQNKQNIKHHKQATDDDQKYELILNGKKMQEERHPYGKSRQIKRQKMAPTAYDQQDYMQKERKSLGSAINTPKYISKTEKSQGNKKRSQLYDIESFKIEESHVDNRFSTIKRNNKDNGSEMTKKELILEKSEIYLQQDRKDVKREQKTVQDQKVEKLITYGNVESSGNGNLELNDGWTYKGQYIRGMFHGYGELYHLNKLIYSGKFQYGYFDGHGKLQYHSIFDRLISSKSITQRLHKHAKKHNKTIRDMNFKYDWLAYFGEFSKGCITGYGQLWINTGQKVVSKWESGQLNKKCYTIQEGTIN